MAEMNINEKWAELLDYARQHATGEGFHRGYNWLRDAFNEYMDMSDNTPGYGMGGQPGSIYNRKVLAERVCMELGYHVGGRQLVDEAQEAKLRATLDEVVADHGRTNGIKV